MNSSKSKVVGFLRFIAILPSTILVYLIARGLFNLILYLAWGDDGIEGFMLKYVAPFLYCAIAGYFSIFAAVLIAPTFKKATAIIVTIVYSIILLIVIYFFSQNKVFSIGTLLEQIGMLIGASVAAYNTIEDADSL